MYWGFKNNWEGISIAGVSKLLSSGQIWPLARFRMTHELSLAFTFLKGCKIKPNKIKKNMR